MKIFFILSLAFLGTVISSFSQTIDNGDFENFIYCPPSWNPDLTVEDVMDGWINVSGTSDGLHTSCAPLSPENATWMPSVAYGDGYGGVWSRYEGMACRSLQAKPTRSSGCRAEPG